MTSVLLIDGENIASAHAPAILAAVPADCRIRRVYGDVLRLNGWMSVPGLRPVHAAQGRNSADILLAVEAVDLFHRAGARAFVLVTSDGGLAHLATHLREVGAQVTVMAEAKAGEALRAAGTRFVELCPIAATPPAKPVAKPPAKPPAPPPVQAARPGLEDFVAERLRKAGSDGLPVTDLDPLARKELGIAIGSLPEKTWRAWLTADCRKARFALDPRGQQARVRLASLSS